MKIKVISYGKRKSGLKTAEIVVNKTTIHVVKSGEIWRDRDGFTYELPKS